ncbi:MAG TPA: primosomal protein N' [Gemmataceae bacterium]|nr:primosomal protein N' [Gemmataceae bacterium]
MNTTSPRRAASSGDLFGSSEEAPIAAGLYADVVFDRPLDAAYTYAVPDHLHDAVGVGKRVEAPFGRGDKTTIGYCVGLKADAPRREVKSIQRVLDDEALLTDNLLRLTRWMADYYLCGWGQVLQAVLPAGVRDRAGTRKAVVIEAVPVSESPDPPPKLTVKQASVLEFLRHAGEPIEQRHLIRHTKSGPAVVEALVAKGLVRKAVRQVDSGSGEETSPRSRLAEPLELNADQLAAWAPIERAVRDGGFKSFLLHGVTGSGKTELYLRAIEEVVRQGKEAIVLVPEISLTPQTIERFRGRCASVAVLHSHLGDAERGGHWRRVAAGHVQVVVGARSAVFAPTKKLGLVVIDEEHETTFKQESTPRYHARDVAVMRARLENIPILMGSATPALESWHNAQKGQYSLLTLPQRVAERPMPPVRIVDLRHEAPARGRLSAISPTLERAMRQALDAEGQVILLLNRRGFSTHVYCGDCGHVLTCKHCDLALTFHRQRNSLLCHYCGYEDPPTYDCPQCGKRTVRYQGLGTEKLQEEIADKFPDKVVQRMDSDSMGRPGSHARVLDAFRDGRIHILLGTQMIAKGLDFPNVTLVGVINADVGLHLPDFRAAERTLQLLSQVAGRAGRGPRGGQVLIQTFTPDHPSIALAASHDYCQFAERELTQRRLHSYPPYQRLVRMIVRSLDQESAAAFAETLAGAFREALNNEARRAGSVSDRSTADTAIRLLGPAEAPVFRLNGYYRFHFQLQSSSAAALHRVLREVLAVVRPPATVETSVDVDPFNML